MQWGLSVVNIIRPTKRDLSNLFVKDKIDNISYLFSWQFATKLKENGALLPSKIFPFIAVILILDTKLVDLFNLIPYSFSDLKFFDGPTTRLLALFWGSLFLFISQVIYAFKCPDISKNESVVAAINYFRSTPTVTGVTYIVKIFEDYIADPIRVINDKIYRGYSYSGDSIEVPFSVVDSAMPEIEKIHYSIEKLDERFNKPISLVISDSNGFDEVIRSSYLLASYHNPTSRLIFFISTIIGWSLIVLNTFEVVIRVFALTFNRLFA